MPALTSMNHDGSLISGSDYLEKHHDFKLIGRERELDSLCSILVRKNANSVILSGAAGVGCEYLVCGVQALKKQPDAPLDIVSKRIFWLNCDHLFSSGDYASINAEFQRIMHRLQVATNCLLVIEDARDFLEGARNANCNHFVNALVNYVWDGEFQVILISRDEELEGVLKAHNDFKELFTVMSLDEPTGDTLTAIVDAGAKSLARHHGIRYGADAVPTAIKLTNKYNVADPSLSCAQPKRAITLLDRTYSWYKLLSHRAPPPGMDEAEWRAHQAELAVLHKDQRQGEDLIVGLEDEIVDLKKSQVDASVSAALDTVDTPAIAERREKIKKYRGMVDQVIHSVWQITSKMNASLAVDGQTVKREFSVISGIPGDKLDQNDRQKLVDMEAAINAKLFGQADAVRQVVNSIKVAKVGQKSGDSPLAAFMFLGPSGVGKTEICRLLAQLLMDDARALSRFDMSEYMEKHAVAKLIGAPPGYDGFEAGGILTNMMRKNRQRILLFDEIEKAHPDVFNIFLQILDGARLTDAVGRVVSFEDAIVLMTTNTGQPHFLDMSLTWEQQVANAMGDLTTTYRGEFLNRFDGRQNIICFQRLEIASIERIFRREMSKVNDAFAERFISVSMTDGDIRELCAELYDPRTGARGLPGYIKTHIQPTLVNWVLNHKDPAQFEAKFIGGGNVEINIVRRV
jgi:ATP-dependent Clp protease ATP-binding subunit ClpB